MTILGWIALSLLIAILLGVGLLVWVVKPPQAPTDSEQKDYEKELWRKYLDKHKDRP